MTIESLTERLQKATEKAEKKANTIEKKKALIAKKMAKAEKTTDEREASYIRSDIYWLEEDIERLTKEIAETKKTIAKYEAQLAGEMEKEAVFAKEIPESMKLMQTQLVDIWDKWDIDRRENLRKVMDEVGYREFFKKYKLADYDMLHTTNDEIHRHNVNDARVLVLDLYNRVKAITGEVTDWKGIHAEPGTWGFAVLNGVVVGKEGRCRVESILAGGYNIQRLHVRVLTHAI